jgi:hypothetical protein
MRKARLSRLKMGVRSVLAGQISPSKAGLELLRRGRVKLSRRRERLLVGNLSSQPAQLTDPYNGYSPAELLNHFRHRSNPVFFAGFESDQESLAPLHARLFPGETEAVVQTATLITKQHRWPLLGFGIKNFGDPIDWNRDPLTGRQWPGHFHADITLWHNDGSDIRVLWELNRLGHLITLGRAYRLTGNEEFAREFLNQVESWREQNAIGFGANWCCAMEVALRAMNLLAAFTLFRRSIQLSEEGMLQFLALLEQHGSHIERNLEFSYIATGNHYLSDVVGLLWIGIMLPELRRAKQWREWALTEMLRELDKQVLDDGGDFEASTGYHRFVLELFLYSFVLCKQNGVEIDESKGRKLELMLNYIKAYLRPDGLAPLIGDTDSGQALPIRHRAANDHDYILAVGEMAFDRAKSKPCEELFWIFGPTALEKTIMSGVAAERSAAFPNTGTYIMRKDDLYLAFNASGAGGNGRGSHGHNDALSIEVSACDCAFIVDPGSYLYTADLQERHLFRSTAYHSTLQVDDSEQNTTYKAVPFVIGDEAHPRVLRWESNDSRDLLVAEHDGYKRLSNPVTHRRTVTFDKQARFWLVEDELFGSGEHSIAVRFHFNSGLELSLTEDRMAVAYDKITSSCLFVSSFDSPHEPELEASFVSSDYGAKQESISVVWRAKTSGSAKFRWALVPVCKGENQAERLSVIKSR